MFDAGSLIGEGSSDLLEVHVLLRSGFAGYPAACGGITWPDSVRKGRLRTGL